MTAPDVRRLRNEFKEPHELVRTSDGKVLFLRHWPSTGRSDLAILVVHGITAYSEPYGKLLAEELARAGLPVFGLDLRGHGRSDGIRGDYPSRDRLAKDLCETVALLKRKFSKVVILGHSLGVLSAIVAVNHCPAGVDGLILLSVGRQVRPGAYGKPSPRVVLRTLLGISLFQRIPLIEYSRKGMMGRGDPLFNFRYTARFYSTMYGTSAWSVVRNLRAKAFESPNLTILGRRDLPVLVSVGDQDEIFAVESTRAFFESLSSNRKEFIVIPGGRHTSFPPGSWGPLVAWVRDQFPSEDVKFA
jgi:acylglycerol lipase